MRETKPRRAAIITLPSELISRLIGLPDDVWIRSLWADPGSISVKVLLESDIRFKPVPDDHETPQIPSNIEMRLMPAPPVAGDKTPQHAPNEDDVLFVRFVLDNLPAPDEGPTT